MRGYHFRSMPQTAESNRCVKRSCICPKVLVDVIVVGPSLDDGTRDELLNELRARHANIPLIAVGGPREPAPLDALAYGAIEALGDDETPRLGATMLRAIRDAGLGRALRAAHDELQGVLSLSDRHSSLRTNAPALIWSTDETLTLCSIEGAEADAVPSVCRSVIGIVWWQRRRGAARRCASRCAGRRDDDDSRELARPFAPSHRLAGL